MTEAQLHELANGHRDRRAAEVLAEALRIIELRRNVGNSAYDEQAEACAQALRAQTQPADVLVDKSNGLGKMIRVLRKQAHMTQAELASGAGLERTSITNIETGRQTLNVQTVNAIANALGYTVHVTFRRKKPNVRA